MDTITALCREAIEKDKPYDLKAIIAAIEATDMTDDATFHDMMWGLFGGETGEGLLSPQDIARAIGISNSTMQRYIMKQAVPRREGRTQMIRRVILEQLRPAAKMLDQL